MPNRFTWNGGASNTQFDDIIGQPQPKLEQMQIIRRLGEAGESFRETGVRAPEQTIRTIVYVSDRAAAKTLVDGTYKPLVDDNEVITITQHNQSWGNYRIRTFQMAPLAPVLNTIGAINGSSMTILLAVDWRIIGTT